MDKPGATPGPISDKTYEQGLRIAAAVGLAAVVAVFWVGPLSPSEPGHVLMIAALFPIYLLFVAVGLGVWLGYTTDERNLRRVTEDDMDSEDDLDDRTNRWPW